MSSNLARKQVTPETVQITISPEIAPLNERAYATKNIKLWAEFLIEESQFLTEIAHKFIALHSYSTLCYG